MTIRAITFDFWGTLFRNANGEARTQRRIDQLCEATGCAAGDAAEALEEVAREFMRVHIEEKRTKTPEDAVDIACRHLGRTLGEEQASRLAGQFARAIVEHPAVPIDDALEAVEAAAGACPIGLISDTGISPGSSLSQLLERNGFLPHFAALTYSDEVGVSKPQAPMFERTAQALGVAPHEILHIGDLEPTDIDGILAMGGTAALFAGENDRFREVTRAQHTFDVWRDFITALPALLA